MSIKRMKRSGAAVRFEMQDHLSPLGDPWHYPFDAGVDNRLDLSRLSVCDKIRSTFRRLQMGDAKRSNVKQSAREAIDSLPENTTWDDVIYRMYVRQKIEEGLADVEAGRVVDAETLRRDLGIGR